MFKTISQSEVTAEIVEKKSKFIANIYYVETVIEAEEKIKEVKKKYYDARHNCFAYSIFSKDGIINRFSDDGEPSGTAGSPMLNIINSKNLSNILVVVTRYFGGILLGTGGLVRAYTGALQEALNSCTEVEKDLGLEVEFEVIYADFEKIKYYLNQNNIKMLNIEYKENISIVVEICRKKLEKIEFDKNELNFKILDTKIIKEKYIENG